MNEHAKAWVERLRNGNIKQGRQYLGTPDGARCCLGVACDMAVEAGIIPPPAIGPYSIEGFSILRYNQDTVSLPKVVMKWLGLADRYGRWEGWEETMTKCLSFQNDAGASFAAIADIIESEPDGLFVQVGE
jgi:hypothetical protein